MPIKIKLLLLWMLCPILGLAQELRLVEPTKTPFHQNQSSAVNAISFSPDGQWLLMASEASEPLLMNIDTRRTFNLIGHQASVNAVAFSPEGQFILTASSDETAKLWNLKGEQLQSFPMEGPVLSVAFSPNWATDSLLLTGSWNQAQLWNIKGTSFRSLRSVNSSVAHLSFDEDYRIITAGRVNLSKGRQPTESDVANARSTLFARSPNGQNFLSGTLENVQVWNLNEPGNVPQSYNPAGTIRPSRQIFLKDLEGTVQARFTMEDTPSYVLSYTPDGQGFLVGVGNDIVYYNLQGQKIRTYRGHTKPVRSLAFTPDGRHFATGSEDFSTQIWSFDQPKAIAAIALQRPGIWAVLEPTGLFDASDSAMQQVSYNCFYGNEELTISLQQLKQRYYEPGLLAVLLGRSTFALRNVPDIQSLKLYPRINVLDRLNGRMNIFLRPRNGGIGKVSLYLNGVEVEEDINPNRLNDLRVNLLQYDAFLNADIDLDNIVLKVYNEEGWLVSAGIFLNSRGPSDTYAPGNYTGILPGDYTNDYPINRLNPKIHILSIGTSDYRGSDLDLAFADQDAQSMAIALATAGQKLFRSWRGADVFCLTTTQNDSLSMMQENIQWDFASKQQIEQSIKAIGDSARPEDIVVLFLAGHGLSRHEENGSKFYYLNQGIDSELMLDDPVLRAKHTISSEEMTHWLKAIKAKKKILIIDACNAGRMIEEMAVAQTRSVDPAQIRAFDRMKDRTGMYILSGSASDKVSYESTEFGHGLLTYALLNGMRGSATKKMPDGKQLIDVMRLFQFVVDEVPALANRIKGIQTPVLSVPANASSFDIGLVDETVIIPMSINKPVIKRSAFLDKDSFNDRLSLAEQLSSLFSEENSKGQNANFVFIDVNDYPQAYSLGGLYEVIDGEIHLTMKLSRDNQFITKLVIPPTNDIKVLVKSINSAFKKYLYNTEAQ